MLQGESALIVTTMKNEGPYVIDWIAHHMAVGFDSFIVATNDCDDGTDRILERLEKLVPIKHFPNPKSLFPDRGNWHVMTLRYAALWNLYKDAGWIYFCDVDEYLHVWVGNGQLDDFYEASGGFDVVSFTSMPFGSNGVTKIVDTPVPTQFTVQSKDYAAASAEGRTHSNAIKTMFHNRVEFDLRRNHRPRRSDFSSSGYRWINGAGKAFSPQWVDGTDKAISPDGSVTLAQFNHYAIRSSDAFLIKLARGDATGEPRLENAQRLKYWRGYDNRGDVDTRAATPSPEMLRIRAELLSDPEIGALHAEAVAIHQQKAARLRVHPDFAPLLPDLGLAGAEG